MKIENIVSTILCSQKLNIANHFQSLMLVMKVHPIIREEYMRNMTNLSVLAIHDKLFNLYCLLF